MTRNRAEGSRLDLATDETAPAVADQLGSQAFPCSNSDAEVVAVAGVCTVGEDATSTHVPALYRSATTTATTPTSAGLRGLAD